MACRRNSGQGRAFRLGGEDPREIFACGPESEATRGVHLCIIKGARYRTVDRPSEARRSRTALSRGNGMSAVKRCAGLLVCLAGVTLFAGEANAQFSRGFSVPTGASKIGAMKKAGAGKAGAMKAGGSKMAGIKIGGTKWVARRARYFSRGIVWPAESRRSRSAEQSPVRVTHRGRTHTRRGP